jgi:hypothetical protein
MIGHVASLQARSMTRACRCYPGRSEGRAAPPPLSSRPEPACGSARAQSRDPGAPDRARACGAGLCAPRGPLGCARACGPWIPDISLTRNSGMTSGAQEAWTTARRGAEVWDDGGGAKVRDDTERTARNSGMTTGELPRAVIAALDGAGANVPVKPSGCAQCWDDNEVRTRCERMACGGSRDGQRDFVLAESRRMAALSALEPVCR